MNDIQRTLTRAKPAAALLLALAICGPQVAFAQTTQAEGPWRFGGSIYLYLPTLSGSSKVPIDTGGTSITVDAEKILDNLKGAFMGSLDAHNGRWGVFSDLMYLHLGNTKENSRDFTIGNVGLPAGTSANIDWKLKGLILTNAGEYRLVSNSALTLDALAGVRLFDMQQTIRWNIQGSLGPATGGRIGESSVKLKMWDAIGGVKGRYWFDDKWSLPFYADVGTGESDLTYQAAAGVSYKLSWGEMTAMWRYLGYEMKSGKVINDLSFNGPLIGATFRW